MILFAILVAAIVITLTKRVVTIYLCYVRLSVVPQPPLDSYIHGHKPSLDEANRNNGLLDLFQRWTNEFGDTLIFWTRTRPSFLTSCPQLLHEATTDLVRFIKVDRLPSRAFYEQKVIGYDSILSGGGEKWAIKRKVLTKYFAKTNMETLFNECKKHMETTELARYIDLVGKGANLEMIHELGTTFTSYLKVMGFRGEKLTAEMITTQMAKILDVIPEQLGMSVSMLKMKFSGEKAASIKMIKEMRVKIAYGIRKKVTEINRMQEPEEELCDTDLLGYICWAVIKSRSRVKTAKINKKEMSTVIEMLVDETMTVYFVTDNLAKQITTLLMAIQKYPDVGQKMFKELRETEITDYNSLKKLKYTEKCILECLRDSPVLQRGVRRFVAKNGNYKVGNYNVHASNILVIFSQHVIHHREKYWKDPYVFNPDRWTEDFSPEPFTYLPFLIGPRSCIAKHYSMFCMKLTLSVLARNFEMTPNFDKANPPVINQARALMRIKNNVDYYFRPLR